MAATLTMQAPTPAYTTIIGASGTVYYSNTAGVVTNVLASDVASLQAGGYTVISGTFAAFSVALLSGRNTDGSSLAAAAAAGKFGMAITLGTSSSLVSQAANSSTITDSVIFEVEVPINVPENYNPTITVNTDYVLGSGTVTTHTLAAHCYPIGSTGAQSADIVTTTAQTLPSTAGNLVFDTAASGEVVAGGRLMIELVLEITETAGSNVTGNINSVQVS